MREPFLSEIDAPPRRRSLTLATPPKKFPFPFFFSRSRLFFLLCKDKARPGQTCAREKTGRQKLGGGLGGRKIFPRLPEKRSPAALLVQSRVPQKSFLFLLEEKIGRAQIRKCEEDFFAGWRASASGGGAERQSSQSGFSSKKVRILTKRHRI